MVGNPYMAHPERHPANKAVVIDGKRYPSSKAAAAAIGIHRNTVYRRLRRGEYRYAGDKRDAKKQIRPKRR